MRRAMFAIKTMGIFACALFLSALCYALRRLPVFEKGDAYELYLGSSSSAQVLLTSDPALEKFLHGGVKGESVRYEGDRFEEIREKFHAELIFTETCAGVTSYYLFSPDLGGGVELSEGRVNLHIAVGHGQTAAGTPLIFGGF